MNENLSPTPLEDEMMVEKSLRPQFFNQYIGQDKVKEQLEIFIKAARLREEVLDHVLLFGPPGLGKTTMAFVISNELGVNIKQTSGPAIEKPGDLVAILNELEPGDVLFIDEIHRMPMQVEEVLYSAMEDFYIDIMLGSGDGSRSVHLDLPPFTLVGCFPILCVRVLEFQLIWNITLNVTWRKLSNGQRIYLKWRLWIKERLRLHCEAEAHHVSQIAC